MAQPAPTPSATPRVQPPPIGAPRVPAERGAASPPQDPGSRSTLVHQSSDALRSAVTVVIVGTALLRLLSVQVAQPVFDMDPLLAPGGQGGIAPGISMLLDAVVLVASAVGLLAEHRRGAGVRVWLLALALLPAVSLATRLGAPVEQLWRGATWLSAMVGAVALAHLVRDPGQRRLATTLLLAGLGALALRGIGQVLVEHPRSVAAYAELRDAMLAERGWSADSPAARIYEERLRQREATGWFGLSNVFSSTMVVAAIASAGLFVAAQRGRLRSVAALAVGLLAAAALLLLLINGSKGALAALLIGAALLALGLRAPLREPRRAGTLAPLLALALPMVAFVAVLVRGGVLPEGFVGERSLLFRWHYLVNATKVFAARPWRGVGPDGFQQAMVQVRSPHHAEEVSSVHSIAADWLVGLGVLGVAWVALLAVLLLWAGRAVESAPALLPPSGARSAPRRPVVVVLFVGLLAIWLEAGTLDPALLLWRAAGVAASVGLAAAIWTILERAEDDSGSKNQSLVAARWALFAAMVALVVHAQVEMTFWLSGSVAWAMALVGVSGVVGDERRAPEASRHAPPPALMGALMGAMAAALLGTLLASGAVAWLGVRSFVIERSLRSAAQPLEQLAEAKLFAAGLATASERVDATELRESLRAAGFESETIESIVGRLGSADREDREIALRTLDEAFRETEEVDRRRAIERLATVADGPDLRPLLALGDQALRLAAVGDSQLRREAASDALALVDRRRVASSAAENDLRVARLRAELLEALGRDGDLESRVAAAAAWDEVVQRDPCSMPLRLRAADAHDRAGDPAAALAALQKALELDAALRLDAKKRLDPTRRGEVEARVRARRIQVEGR